MSLRNSPSEKESSSFSGGSPKKQCLGILAVGALLFVGTSFFNETKFIETTKLLMSSSSLASPYSVSESATMKLRMKELLGEESTSDQKIKERKVGGVCESFPMSDRSLPLGASLSLITDGFAPACNGVYVQRSRTFKLSFERKTPLTVKKRKFLPYSEEDQQQPINCSQVSPPSTVNSFNRLDDKVPTYDHIRQCFSQSEHPFISFRGAPKKDFGPSEIGSKDGISILTKKYAPCDEIKNPGSCILPETFRISDSQDDCQRYFNTVRQEQNNPDPTKSPRLWVRKPVHGLGGVGVEKLFDPLEQLKDYAAACTDDDLRGSLRKIVVQQYIRPKLVLDGRSFHLRVYFLYKFGRDPSKLHSSKQTPTSSSSSSLAQEDDDPPQAWHIKIGNVHLCSEPYSMINDPKMSMFAVKCNGMAWKENPRIIREGGWMEFNFTMPYPSFLQESFTKAEYDLVMKRIDELLKTVAKVLRGTAEQETQTFANNGEALWMILGNDIMIDENLRPWLIEVNACPGNIEYGPENILKNAPNLSRNPHMAAYRLVMTHYKRYLVGDDYYDENACEDDDGLGSYVTRLM